MRRALLLASAAAALSSLGCGAEVPAGGVAAPDAEKKQISRRVDPNEVIPRDLDVVVRMDLARLKEALGPKPEEELATRLTDDPNVGRALARARALTLGLRASHLDQGDHVLVVEGDMKELELDTGEYREERSSNDQIRTFVRDGFVQRRDTALLVRLDERAVAFASPAEADAVMRVLRNGPDEGRGEPAAEGLVSVDVRPRRLDPALEQRFPSISRIVAQIQRVRGVMLIKADSVGIDLDVVAKSEASAVRVARFFEALREGADPQGLSSVLKRLDVEALGTTVHLSVRVPAELLLAVIARSGAAAEPPPPP
jgi:hypothetical protein